MSRSFFIVFSVVLLSGCGVRGGLEVPDPLFGQAEGPPPPIPELYERDDRGLSDGVDLVTTLPGGGQISADPDTVEDPFATDEEADEESDS